MKKLSTQFLFIFTFFFATVQGQNLNIEGGILNIGVINTGASSPDGAHWFEVTGSGYNPFEIVYVDSPSALFTVSISGTAGSYSTSVFFTADASGDINQYVYVKYSPEIAGVVPSQLSIYEFQTFTFQDKSVQGIGKAPEIMLEGRPNEGSSWTEINNNEPDPTVIQGNDFGETAYGVDTTYRTFRITNDLPLGGLNGDLLLFEFMPGNIIEITGVNADQFFVDLEPASVVYPDFDTTQMVIGFAPTSFGLKTATVSISNNDTDENPFVFTVEGKGIIEPAAVPVIKKASFVDHNSFTANWAPGSGGAATGYLLDISPDPQFFDFLPGFQGKDVGNVTSKNVLSLDAATVYYYRLRAYKPGDTSGYSSVMTVQTAPPVPTIMPASVIEKNAFYANWTFVAEATEYRLDVNTSPDFNGYNVLQNAPAINNYLHVENLTGGVTYYYRVRSFNGQQSENSATISAVTLPEKPVAENATQIIDEGFTANWYFSNPIFVEGFLLDISTDPGFSTFIPGYENYSVGPFLQAYIFGLNPETTYYYRVRTRYANDTTGYSNVMNVTTTLFAPQVEVDIKVMLEGAFNGVEMSSLLNSGGHLPLDQPYAAIPWNYNGPETIGTIPSAEVVDWILVELLKRDQTDTNIYHLLGTRAALLLNDGQVVGLNGSDNVGFKTVVEGDYYIHLHHRNHLPVISSNPMTELNGVYTYDFTVAQGETSGVFDGQKELVPGQWGMMAADGDGNGEINTKDINDMWYPALNQTGYFQGDFNLDGVVDATDKELIWKVNAGRGVSGQSYEVEGDNT